MREPILEPLLRRLRIGKVIEEIKKAPDCRLLDIGCGYDYKFLSTVQSYIGHGTGVDFKVPEMQSEKLLTIQTRLDEHLPFNDNSFDIVTMLAVLEHLSKPQAICAEIARILKSGGKLILTVPGKRARPVLEFLSFQLGIVNRAEIEDHKKYYDLEELQALIEPLGKMRILRHRHFQWGMNNFCVIAKR